MKFYLVRRNKKNIRWFDNDSDLIEFFINVPESINSYQVTILSAEVESEWSGDKLFDAIKEQSELDRKLTIALGDEYSIKVQRLIEMYKNLCNKTPWDKTKMTIEALKVYEKLITTEPEEIKFQKVVKSCQRYLLYSVSDSVEWYSAILDVYPKIKSLDETCGVEYVDPVTRGTSWIGGRTPLKMVKNFEKAKNNK